MSQISSNELSASPLARIDGWNITMPTLGATISAIATRAENAESFTVFTLNLDHVVKLRRDAAFRDAYAQASIVTAPLAPTSYCR